MALIVNSSNNLFSIAIIVVIILNIYFLIILNKNCEKCKDPIVCEECLYKNTTFSFDRGYFIGIAKQENDKIIRVCGSQYFYDGGYRHGIFNNNGNFIIGSAKDNDFGEGQYYYGRKGLFKIKLVDGEFYMGEFENTTYSKRGFFSSIQYDEFKVGYYKDIGATSSCRCKIGEFSKKINTFY